MSEQRLSSLPVLGPAGVFGYHHCVGSAVADIGHRSEDVYAEHAIQAALDGCPANQVVQLTAGVFKISGNGLNFVSPNCTLRGAGPGQGLNTGVNPRGTLLRDANGALYGSNMLGGAYYNGTIFKLTPPGAGQTGWALSILYTFMGGTDGGLPNSGLVMDSSGAIYGTADSGGYSWLNQGVVFKLTPPAPGTTQWHYSVIHSFYHSYAYGADDAVASSSGVGSSRSTRIDAFLGSLRSAGDKAGRSRRQRSISTAASSTMLAPSSPPA